MIISKKDELYNITLYTALPPVSCCNLYHHCHPSIDQKYPHCHVSFVAKFANVIIVLNHHLIQFRRPNYQINHPKHDGESLVEILSSIIVATAGLDNPSLKPEKIGKLLVSDNNLQRLNTEFIQLGHSTHQVAPSSG